MSVYPDFLRCDLKNVAIIYLQLDLLLLLASFVVLAVSKAEAREEKGRGKREGEHAMAEEEAIEGVEDVASPGN